jgi:hypothetical protein
MILTKEQYETLLEAAKPLIAWMRSNCSHPHYTAIVAGPTVELLEGIARHSVVTHDTAERAENGHDSYIG